jgi:hypothetical protein
VTVTVKVIAEELLQDRVESPPAGRDMLLGLRALQERPVAGEVDVIDRLTVPLDALPPFTEIVELPVAPARTLTELGFEARKKSVDERTVTATGVVRNAPPPEALTVRVTGPVMVPDVALKIKNLV